MRYCDSDVAVLGALLDQASRHGGSGPTYEACPPYSLPDPGENDVILGVMVPDSMRIFGPQQCQWIAHTIGAVLSIALC